MSTQITLGIFVVSFGSLATTLLLLMVRYEIKSGKSLYWFHPGRRLTREDGLIFRIRTGVGLPLAIICGAITLWFLVLLVEGLAQRW
jgi:hypothetical protein